VTGRAILLLLIPDSSSREHCDGMLAASVACDQLRAELQQAPAPEEGQ
jgi:hypothetical protein